MTHNLDKASNEPWWQSQLAIIPGEQLAYLRQRLPALRADYPELISQTRLAITKLIAENPSNYPASWFAPGEPEEDAERWYFYKLANTILKRRAVDLLRRHQRETRFSDFSRKQEAIYEIADTSSQAPDRKILLAELLKITDSILDGMAVEDRDLVALVAIAAEEGKHLALNPRNRKRLERIRKRLRNEISRRLGANLRELLSFP